MRVTVEHREETTGVIGSKKDCYVDCKVEFSEEERAIIKERDLYREAFTVRTSTPVPTEAAYFGVAAMRTIGRFMIMGGAAYSIYEGLAHVPTNYGGPIFFIGIGLEIYGWVRGRKQDKRIESSEQRITIKQLLSNPAFTVHAWNAGYAKGIEEEIRQHLVGLKGLIKDSAQLQAKQTFEL
jgi:hypothetical protein